MSYLDFSGFYFPFTGEANLNDESPACYLPANICHELAHQQGIATEQECNFVGILAAITAESPAYQYSGYLMGYVHLANALYRRRLRRGRPSGTVCRTRCGPTCGRTAPIGRSSTGW